MATASPASDGFSEALKQAEAQLRRCPDTRARFKRTVTRAMEAAQEPEAQPAPAPARAPERRSARHGFFGWLMAGVSALFAAAPR